MEINLLQEEIDQLKKIREKTEKLTLSIGEIAVQKARLDFIEAALKEDLRELMLEEETLSDTLVKKYGPVSINLEKGIATEIG